jgi:hypothetical protein
MTTATANGTAAAPAKPESKFDRIRAAARTGRDSTFAIRFRDKETGEAAVLSYDGSPLTFTPESVKAFAGERSATFSAKKVLANGSTLAERKTLPPSVSATTAEAMIS